MEQDERDMEQDEREIWSKMRDLEDICLTRSESPKVSGAAVSKYGESDDGKDEHVDEKQSHNVGHVCQTEGGGGERRE